ncbi:histidine kinase dimerization/phospho-acceptor domain-containing protein [Streptomyces sp. DH10]|nr:histidine kinase dimerization/phospho-acceptor domain-containing protein [Streptomyces sp. DH10]MDG9710637.1 histidine kinase dimerization/phospho-acceptor domain-containing protein [Streptomyces sp. DH10]
MLYENETRLVEELRALDRAKSDFLSTVSHELRTPLTSIVGYIELLKDEDTGPLTGQQSCRARRPAAPLRNREEDNRGGRPQAAPRTRLPASPPRFEHSPERWQVRL